MYKVQRKLALKQVGEHSEYERLMSLGEFAAYAVDHPEILEDDWASQTVPMWIIKTSDSFEPGDVLVDYKGTLVIFEGHVVSQDKLNWLKDYWMKKYNIPVYDITPPTIGQVVYLTSAKIYDYPLNLLKRRTDEWIQAYNEKHNPKPAVQEQFSGYCKSDEEDPRGEHDGYGHTR